MRKISSIQGDTYVLNGSVLAECYDIPMSNLTGMSQYKGYTGRVSADVRLYHPLFQLKLVSRLGKD